MIGHRTFIKYEDKYREMSYDRECEIIKSNEDKSILTLIYRKIYTNDLAEECIELIGYYDTLSPQNLWISQQIKTTPYWYKEVKLNKKTCKDFDEAFDKVLEELKYYCDRHNIENTEILDELFEDIEFITE